MRDNYSFSIEQWYLENDSIDIIERSILRAFKRMYSDGVLNLNPTNVKIINDNQEYASNPEEIDRVVVYFQDKEQ